MKKIKYYLHTINSQPAGFSGEQILYAQRNNNQYGWKAPLCKSLKQIRSEQKKTFKFRKELFGEEPDKYNIKYDYVVIEVER